MQRSLRPLLLALLLSPGAVLAQYANTADCLNPQEAILADIVNDYRQENGLPRVAVSFSLASVGQWHVWDLEVNDPWHDACNLHSWSNARPALWDPVCYTGSLQAAAQMWNKPHQITDGAYNSYGYENAAWNSGTITAASALQGWKNSAGHNEVILNQNSWASHPWRAMGVGVSQHFAVLWFGELTDPLGTMLPCGATNPDRLFGDGFES